MDDVVAIKVEQVGKTFVLPHEKTNSIKSAFVSFYKRNKSFELQRALDDVSFEVKQGEFFGIVGRNGSGKSTLLKLLAGIYTPSAGSVQVHGKLTPFIELGVGFNPELTGRENVFLNGALLGFSRKEMEAMYDDIVDFAELKKFMDQKLKNYSSGMQVRLAFSIAIRAESDILVLDEVLAVGDEAFQKKCIDVFENYKSKKQTVILVTHEMATVKQFCSRAMLVDQGKIVSIGDPTKVANDYTELNNQNVSSETARKNRQQAAKYKTRVELDGDSIVSYGDTVRLRLDWSAAPKGAVKHIGVAVYKNTGEYVFGANTILDDIKLKKAPHAEYVLKADLGPGNYHFKVGAFGDTDSDIIEFVDHGPEFSVKSNKQLKWEGLAFLKHDWKQ